MAAAILASSLPDVDGPAFDFDAWRRAREESRARLRADLESLLSAGVEISEVLATQTIIWTWYADGGRTLTVHV